MAARGLWALRSVEQQLGVVRFLRTLAIFVSAAVLLAPTLAAVHVMVSLARSLWLRVLRWRFPNSLFEESPCIRSAMDTHRTQGVVALLLQVRGRCDPEAIAERLEKEVVMREAEEWRGTCEDGPPTRRLAHPQLSMVLKTRWGRYAWEKAEEFKIERHVVLASSLFRGRPVTEFNVQEYVSDIVSKYLPPDIPPWQATIIPVFSPEERYFILLRLHHLACKGFVLEQLQKAMTPCEEATVPSTPPPPTVQDPDPVVTPIVSPPSPDKLEAPPPKAVRSFTTFLREKTSSAWGEVASSASISQALYSMAGITLGLASEARNLARREGKTYQLAREAVAEALFLTGVAFEGPRILLRELLPERPHPHDHHRDLAARRQSGHHLQSVSLCGRKAVAWSDPAPSELVSKICAATGASHMEILLTAASGALRQFFRQSGLPTPGVVTAALPLPLTAKRDEGGGGFALISLPTREEDGAMALDDLRKQLKAQKNRPSALLLSSWLTKNAARILPSFGIRLLLNALTKKYSVTVSNIPAGPPGSSGFRLWGQEVEGFIIWRPQQANTSVSLSLMTYRGSVRLGVMADQQLSPQHAAIASAFLPQLCDLAASVGVPRERLPSTSTRPTSPRGSGSPWISPLASPRPSPRASPRPSPRSSPDCSPPILRKSKATFLELPALSEAGGGRRRRGDSEGSSGGGAESDASTDGVRQRRKEDADRAAALASAVAHKFRGAIDSD
ncbi:putative diacyglycerol O-acyltransferase Rv3480c isoform X2 [Hetaerina americana]